MKQPDDEKDMKFIDAEKEELRTHGLTVKQLVVLERGIGSVADCVATRARMQDVRNELKKMSGYLNRAGLLLKQWESKEATSAQAEAIGHLGVASAGLLRRWNEPEERLAIAAAIEAIARVANRAVELGPDKPRSDQTSARAIALIVELINQPDDEPSKLAAAALPVTRYDSGSGPSFMCVAQIIFAAVARFHSKTVPSSAENAIREYLKEAARFDEAARGNPFEIGWL